MHNGLEGSQHGLDGAMHVKRLRRKSVWWLSSFFVFEKKGIDAKFLGGGRILNGFHSNRMRL